jgi:hypothetical protein
MEGQSFPMNLRYSIVYILLLSLSLLVIPCTSFQTSSLPSSPSSWLSHHSKHHRRVVFVSSTTTAAASAAAANKMTTKNDDDTKRTTPMTYFQPKPTGSSFLPPETFERATNSGNPIEKVKLEKDGTSAFIDVYEYARKIRNGEMTWEEVEKSDLDTVGL